MTQKMSKKRVTTDDSSGEDRISSLPDHLLCQILSKLTTKYAVRTSVLSKRWKSMWLSVPILDLDQAEIHRGYIDAVESFVNGFLDISREESCIDKLKLDYEWDESDKSYITRWIHNAVIRKLQHLDINSRANVIFRSRGSLVLPLSLNTCETLVYLKLSFVSFADCEHVSLPCLKTMVLVWNVYPNDAFLEKLILSCPVLEDLEIERDDHIESQNTATVSRVRSQSLKSLMLVLSGDKFKDAGDLEVVIDAPRLNYLCLTDDKSTSFLISNLSSSAEVDIDVTFALEIISAANVSSKKSVVRKFFTGLSSVRDMTLSPKTMKIIFQHLKYESLPQFPYMTRLNVESSDYDLEMLPNILESCPNLKSLVLNLELEDFEKNEVFTLPSSVPECLRLSLEYIEMKGSISGAEAEMKPVQYFLESSAVLKKFTLRLGPKRVKKGTIILTELLRLRRCSPYCEVVAELEGQGE